MIILDKCLIILDGYFEIDYKIKRKVIDSVDSVSTFDEFALKTSKLFDEYIKDFDIKKYLKYFNEKFYNKLIESYNKSNVTVITENCEDYPQRLYNIQDRPICLYYTGDISLLQNNKVLSIVGSRKTLPNVLKITEEYSYELAKNGVTIVTGVAGGGDLAAIKGAIKTNKIVSVIASGMDNTFREYNRDYIEKIKNVGLVIGEYPPSVVAQPYHYPIRNRIIAGLSDATLIVSGDYKSGTRYTLNYALDFGRDVFAFPYNIGVASGELCNQVIKDGGYIVTELNDITEILGIDIDSKQKVELSSSEELVLSAIKSGKTNVDDILLETGLKIFEVMPALTSLEIKNLLVKNSASEYSLIK